MKKIVLMLVAFFSLATQAQEEQNVVLQKEGKLGSLIKNAKNVKRLTISGVGLDRKDYQALSKCTSLEYLDVSGMGDYKKALRFNDYGVERVTFPQLQELVVNMDRNDNNLTDGYHENENLPAPYNTDFIILANIGKTTRINNDLDVIHKLAPNIRKCTFKKITAPCSLSFNTPEWLRILDFDLIKRGYSASISLQEGTACFEALETQIKDSRASYHIIYHIAGYIKDPWVLGLLKDAIYIGSHVLDLALEKNQSIEFTIPKQLRYIDTQGLNFLGNVNVKIEESDVPLVISGGGIRTEGVINKFEFNRPVYLCDNALPSFEIKELIFNDNVEYLGNNSFGELETVRFKECPEKMGTIVRYPKKIQRVYVPSHSLTQFNNFGVSYIESVIGTKEQGNLANAGEQTEQMKAIEEGRLLPSFDFIQKNIPILNISAIYPKTINFYNWQMLNLCKEDVFAYTGRQGMDELDKAFYMKSEDYQTDLNSLQEDKNRIYAYMYDLANDSYKNNKQFWASFDVDGITFDCSNLTNNTSLPFAHIGVSELAFPVQPEVTLPGYGTKYKFACSDLDALKKVKDNLGRIAFVILFKPAFAKEVSSFLQSKAVGVLNPVAIYILDKNSGDVVLNLSEYIRDISSEAGYKAEIELIENGNKKAEAIQEKWDKEYREAQAKKKYHQVPKEERCWVCGGKGYNTGVNLDGVLGRTQSRCTVCYGRGYTLEHYY